MLVIKIERGEDEIVTTELIRLDTIPLNRNVELGHRVSQTALEVGPSGVYDYLNMTNQGQHG